MKKLIISLLGFALAHAAIASKPNIIIFLVDDMGIMDTSLPFLTDEKGSPVTHSLNQWYRTPNMERLAEQGIRFNRFYAQSTCSPTRVSIMSGQNAARHLTTNWIAPKSNNRGQFGPYGWNWHGLQEKGNTLPTLLRKSGYRTLFVGKGHFGPSNSRGADPANLGFDVNVGGMEWGQPGSYYGEHKFGLDLEGRESRAVPHLEKYHDKEIFLTEALTLEAMELIEKAAEEQTPFFLYFSHYAVHSPFESDPRFSRNYSKSSKSADAKAFATLIEGMDKSLGDVLAKLESLGIAEETFVIFLGDNGSDAPLGSANEHASSAPLRGKKGSAFEGGIRVPFIATWAKPNSNAAIQRSYPVAKNTIQTQLAGVEDLFPTILSLAGAQIPKKHKIDGTDLKPQISGQRNLDRFDSYLVHYPHEHRNNYFTSYIEGDWKLIYRYNPATPNSSQIELYHLASDPTEIHDRSTSEPQKTAHMLQSMVADLESKDALFPIDTNGNPLKPGLQ